MVSCSFSTAASKRLYVEQIGLHFQPAFLLLCAPAVSLLSFYLRLWAVLPPAGRLPEIKVAFCFQGGHVLTPLPAATPMKPGSAVSKAEHDV